MNVIKEESRGLWRHDFVFYCRMDVGLTSGNLRSIIALIDISDQGSTPSRERVYSESVLAGRHQCPAAAPFFILDAVRLPWLQLNGLSTIGPLATGWRADAREEEPLEKGHGRSHCIYLNGYSINQEKARCLTKRSLRDEIS